MARKKNNVPSYLLHAQSGQARVRINGREYLLGRFGSEESRVRYGKIISQAAGGLSVDPLGKNHNDADSGLSVAELLLAFKRHADAYYSKDGKKTAEVDCFKSAMRAVRELFALNRAKDFSPLCLKTVQPEFGIRDLGLEKIQKEGSSLVGTVFKDTKELPDGLGRTFLRSG